MKRLINLLALFAILGIVIAGCQNEPYPVESRSLKTPIQGKLTGMGGLAQATLESATLYVYVSQASSQVVNLHRITDDWEETSVTWNNFGGSYDATVEGSFTPTDTGWYSVDVTALVQAWMDATYENYGILMAQDYQTSPRTILHSRENDENQPYLEVCFATSGDPDCTDVMADADAYIYELYPDANTGTADVLNIGWYSETDLEKQALISFELPEMPEPAALGDYVWHDEDMDGIQDAEESGIPDVTVNLYDCEDNLIATTTTDADGYYLFSDLTPGDYYVEFVKPEGYTFTLQDQGSDDAVDSDADPTTGLTVCTTLDAGETDLTWDAGLYMPPHEGCTLTIGFWKNHAGFGPQPDLVTALLPIWLGTEDGDKSIAVTDAGIAVDVLKMKTYGKPSNGITKLYAQLLGAKLNIANGADDYDIADAIAEIDEFLAEYDYTDWNSLSKAEKKMVLGWKDMMDDYNNGDIGPGHCDDMNGDDD